MDDLFTKVAFRYLKIYVVRNETLLIILSLFGNTCPPLSLMAGKKDCSKSRILHRQSLPVIVASTEPVAIGGIRTIATKNVFRFSIYSLFPDVFCAHYYSRFSRDNLSEE